jgi:hypothetical protein
VVLPSTVAQACCILRSLLHVRPAGRCGVLKVVALIVVSVAVQDAWLGAESAWALKRVESVLYSPEGWERGQLLVAEDGPAWEADFWPPRAAEEVCTADHYPSYAVEAELAASR